MADVVSVTAVSALIYTGKGQLAGIVLSCSSTTAALATFYDNTSAAGTKLLEVYVASPDPVIIFFGERLAPVFAIGLYLALAAH
jgi:hypothetical protein